MKKETPVEGLSKHFTTFWGTPFIKNTFELLILKNFVIIIVIPTHTKLFFKRKIKWHEIQKSSLENFLKS